MVLKKFPNFEVILHTYKLVLLSLKIGTIYRIYLGVCRFIFANFFVIMAGYLRGYDYEPEKNLRTFEGGRYNQRVTPQNMYRIS